MLVDLKHLAKRVRKGIRNLPNLARGYNIYVDRDKLDLITHTFKTIYPQASSFADLGGVWKVSAGYTFFTLENFAIDRGYIVDFRFDNHVDGKIKAFNNLIKIKGDFTSNEALKEIGHVDIIFLFFDVLLHQVRPDWNEVLSMYSGSADCFVIFNQQYVRSNTSFRLTDLPLEQYEVLVPTNRYELYDFIYSHKLELNKEYGKQWIEIPDIFQWAITDVDLRSVMNGLGFKEVFYKNFGGFSNSRVFENHAFIFVKASFG